MVSFVYKYQMQEINISIFHVYSCFTFRIDEEMVEGWWGLSNGKLEVFKGLLVKFSASVHIDLG